jgi:hypothetical protein
MSLHRTILVACAAALVSIFSSAAFAQCGGCGVPIQPVVVQPVEVQPVIVEPAVVPVAPAPIAVSCWDTNGYCGGGCGSGCGGCGGGCGGGFGGGLGLGGFGVGGCGGGGCGGCGGGGCGGCGGGGCGGCGGGGCGGCGGGGCGGFGAGFGGLGVGLGGFGVGCGGGGCGGCGGCSTTFGYHPVAPSPLYVVNQGPEYSGPGLTVPFGTYSPATNVAAPGAYPYVGGSGYDYGHRYARPYYRSRYTYQSYGYNPYRSYPRGWRG